VNFLRERERERERGLRASENRYTEKEEERYKKVVCFPVE
jgi:hypothetical protein